jgi:hypothetical protein
MAEHDLENKRGVRAKKGIVGSDVATIEQLLALKRKLKDEIASVTSKEISLIYEFTAGEDLLKTNVCYFGTDGKMWKANASAELTAKGLLGMALGTIFSGDIGRFLLFGKIELGSSLGIGAVHYLSLSSGHMTITAPSSSGQIVRVVGYALNVSQFIFYPDITWVKIK